MQVAVVDTHQRCVEGFQRALKLIAIMDFNQHIQPDTFGYSRQFGHFHVVQRGDDQQHTVGAQCPGFDDLVRVDHEVLANHRQGAGRTRLLQVRIGALEVVDIGQHGQASCTARLVALGNLGRHEVLANHAFARRSLFDFGNHCGLFCLGLRQ